MIYSPPKNSNNAIHRILILGTGITGWTLAAGLANGLRGLNIDIVVLDDAINREEDTYTEATIPAVLAFHKLLGINEQDLIKKTGASYKLATCYKQWAYKNQDYFLPFSAHGFMLNRIEFPHYALSRQSKETQENALEYDTYALSAVAAKLGRFQHPARDGNSLYSTLDYALHLPCAEYARYLQDYAQQLGVQRIRADVSAVINNTQNGFIEAVVLENVLTPSSHIDQDARLNADLFIDCSGHAGKLIAETYNIPYLATNAVSADCSVAMVSKTEDLISPTSYLSLGAAGWKSRVATQQQTETRYFYNKDYVDHEQAAAQLFSSTDSALLVNNISTASLIFNQYHSGRRQTVWHKNCIAIGESAGYAETFVIGKLHFVQSAVLRLLSLFPATKNYELNCQEYNRLTHLEFEHIADFHALHYAFAREGSSDFWLTARAADLSERNQYRLALFRQRATIPFYENETLSAAMWTSFFLGNQIIPKRYDPLVDGIDAEWINSQLGKMQSLILSAAHAMPTQAQYLKHLTKIHSF